MVTHRLFASYTYISLANSKCWPVMILFILLANSTCWPVMTLFFYWPTQHVGLSQYSQMDVIGSCYSPSHMLGKYFLRCWPLTATGNLTPSNSSSMYAFPGKTWSTLYGPCQVGDHLPNLLSLVPNGNTASETKSPTRKSLGLTLLLYARATLALFSLSFPMTKVLALSGPPRCHPSRLHTVQPIDHSETQHVSIQP